MTEAVTAPVAGDNGASATAAAPTASELLSGASATPAAPAAQASAAPAAPAIDWLKDADELTVGYTQNKGWKDPGEVVRSYQNLEKLFGADKAGNTVVLPKADATPEEMNAFYQKLGRPAEAKDYKLAVPEGSDPAYASAAAEKFYELGLTAKQAEALVEWNNSYLSNFQQQTEQQRVEAFQKEHADLKAEWGMKFDENLVVAKNTVANLGLDAKTIDAMEQAMGHKAVMSLLAKIGSKTGEADFVSGDTQGFSASMTPAQAKAAIQSKMDDRSFVSKYLAKDAEAVAEMQRLHKFAYPEQN